MRRTFGEQLAIIGPFIVMASIAWEYVRMKPDYRFLVEPWSMRGYELTQGRVIFAMGLLLLVMVIAVAWRGSANPVAGAVIAGYVVVAATTLAALYADDRDVGGMWLRVVASILVALIAATVATKYRGAWAGAVRFAAFVGGGAVMFFAVGDRVGLAPAIAVAAGMALLMAWAIIAEPRALTANRALILASVAALFTAVVTSGSIRSRLMTEQLSIIGIASDYKDVQVTSGWLLANVGLVLTVIGAIAMWAKRRDLANAQARAAKQRQAAEESAAEIAASR